MKVITDKISWVIQSETWIMGIIITSKGIKVPLEHLQTQFEQVPFPLAKGGTAGGMRGELTWIVKH
jgi:hypothetical protein